MSSRTSTSIGVESIWTCSPGRAACVGVNTPGGRFAVCRRVTADPKVLPPAGDRVDHFVKRRLARKRNDARAVASLDCLHYSADQPRPGARRGVRFGIDHFANRHDQPGIRASGRRTHSRSALIHQPPQPLLRVSRTAVLHRSHAHPELGGLCLVPLYQCCARRVETPPGWGPDGGAGRQTGHHFDDVSFPRTRLVANCDRQSIEQTDWLDRR